MVKRFYREFKVLKETAKKHQFKIQFDEFELLM